MPPGWGEPVFDRLEADLAKAMLSLPASKGFDIGSGFGGILLTGTQHNDPFRAKGGKVYTTSNRSGGIQGGISNGQTIYFRVAFKPVATVMHEQDTVDIEFKNTTLKGRGRHDPCVLPRAVPIVEAMTALVLVDHALRHQAQCGAGDAFIENPIHGFIMRCARLVAWLHYLAIKRCYPLATGYDVKHSHAPSGLAGQDWTRPFESGGPRTVVSLLSRRAGSRSDAVLRFASGFSVCGRLPSPYRPQYLGK